MVDALAARNDEGRVLAHEKIGKPVSRRYYPVVSEWGNPLCSNTKEPMLLHG